MSRVGFNLWSLVTSRINRAWTKGHRLKACATLHAHSLCKKEFCCLFLREMKMGKRFLAKRIHKLVDRAVQVFVAPAQRVDLVD